MEITTSTLNGNGTLPLIVEPAGEVAPSARELGELIVERRAWLEANLHQYGGVLFRGFSVQTVEEFEHVANQALPQLKPYVEGQSPRKKVGDNVYTSTEFPAPYRITLHNELSYAKSPPPRIIFHCHIPPARGGETPIVDCRKVYKAMNPNIREKFERRGVNYLKNMHGSGWGLGKSWSEHFETTDRNEVESYLRENDIAFQWAADGSLKTWSTRPGTTTHPVTKEPLWFNQANLWHVTNVDERHRKQMLERCGEDNLPTHACYGDGSPIPADELDEVRKVLWDNAVVFPWKQGDVLILDNILVAHGRMPYEPTRKILVAMG
jgi:alpha-ketoglutarate-dependent taurine dioxygenase